MYQRVQNFVNLRYQTFDLRRFASLSARQSRVTKHEVSPIREVPDNIQRPSYARNNFNPALSPSSILTADQLQQMKTSCKLARRILNYAGSLVVPGVSTDFIDSKVHSMIIKEGAYPSPLLYRGFPKSICTSVNEVIAHGIPDSRLLVDGDIVSIDVTIYLNGFHGDCCATFLVGDKVDAAARKLVSTALKCLYKGISVCRPGAELCQIGNTIEAFANENGYSVPPDLVGHGIGTDFHSLPYIFHVRNSEIGKMFPGMVFTIEPVITEGGVENDVWSDNWTLVARDGKWSAQFEHTIAITSEGFEILTKDETDNFESFFEM